MSANKEGQDKKKTTPLTHGHDGGNGGDGGAGEAEKVAGARDKGLRGQDDLKVALGHVLERLDRNLRGLAGFLQEVGRGVRKRWEGGTEHAAHPTRPNGRRTLFFSCSCVRYTSTSSRNVGSLSVTLPRGA